MALIKFKNKGIYCKQDNFYIDPWHLLDCMNEVFEKEFKFDLKNLNEELRGLIKKQ
jgi:hypothetical protein